MERSGKTVVRWHLAQFCSFLSLSPLSFCQLYVFPNWSLLIQTARQIQRVHRRDIRFPPPSTSRPFPLPHPIRRRSTLSTPNLPALLFSLLGLLKTRKSRNREACPWQIFFFRNPASPRGFNGSLPLSLSLSLFSLPFPSSVRSHSPPLFRPFFGPVLLLLARVFSPFFHRDYPGFLTPFFFRQLPRNSCIRRAGSRRASERKRALCVRRVHALACAWARCVNCCAFVLAEFRYYPQWSLSRWAIAGQPISRVAHYCALALCTGFFRVCFSRWGCSWDVTKREGRGGVFRLCRVIVRPNGIGRETDNVERVIG